MNDSPQIERFIGHGSADQVQKKKKAAVKLISRQPGLFSKSLKPFEIKGFLKKESAQPLYQNGCADMAGEEGFEMSKINSIDSIEEI